MAVDRRHTPLENEESEYEKEEEAVGGRVTSVSGAIKHHPRIQSNVFAQCGNVSIWTADVG